MMKEVYLTELQRKCYEMYVVEQMTQFEIAIKLFGDKKKQPIISNVLKSVSQKLGIQLTKQFHKGIKMERCLIEVNDEP
jgi:hypothetical protein